MQTKYCRINSWPLFMPDVIPLFKNMNESTIKCKKQNDIIIMRKDFNGIAIENRLNKTMKCFARSIERRDESDDRIDFTDEVELNLSENSYFKEVIAVNIKCFINQSKSLVFVKVEFIFSI